jgi:hypothetical protein
VWAITQTGNVGIGTPAPAAPLHIEGGSDGDDGAGGVLRIGPSSEHPSRYLILDGDEVEAWDGLARSVFYLNSHGGNVVLLNQSAQTPLGLVGIGRDPTKNRLEVQGTASKITMGDWLANSDRRIKTDIEAISGALDALDAVRLVSFRYADDYRRAHPAIDDRRYLNVIAQEFAEVFPDYVQGSGEYFPDGHEILQVDPWPLTIYSAAAVQELHQIVRDQDAVIAEQAAVNQAQAEALDSQRLLIEELRGALDASEAAHAEQRETNRAQQAQIEDLAARLAQLEARLNERKETRP